MKYMQPVDRGILFQENRIKMFYCDQRDQAAIPEFDRRRTCRPVWTLSLAMVCTALPPRQQADIRSRQIVPQAPSPLPATKVMFPDFETRIVCFHNVYGPQGTYEGGKEKAPAAICRKVALLADGDEIEIWGDGQQTRSFMYIDDCVEGLIRLMASDHRDALNVGTDRLVTVDGLVDIIANIAGKGLRKRHDLAKPQGVRGRNSDNTRLRQALGWEPSITLEDGLAVTYRWIEEELRAANRLQAAETEHAVASDRPRPSQCARSRHQHSQHANGCVGD